MFRPIAELKYDMAVKSALDILSRESVRLVLIDVMMPKLDGLSAVMRIREKQNIPIIVLTAPPFRVCAGYAPSRYFPTQSYPPPRLFCRFLLREIHGRDYA